MELMNQREYAAHRNVTPQRINALVSDGRIQVENDGKIDVAKADLQLDGTADAALARYQKMSATGSLTEARTASESYRGRLLELDYRQRTGEVLDAEDARRAMETLGEMLVRDIDQLQGYADELVSIAVKDGTKGMRARLKAISREIRQTITDNLTLDATDKGEQERSR